MGFTLSYEFARSSGLTVHSLNEFISALKTVDLSSIRFHMERGDFERWLRHVVGDDKLADDIAKINDSKKKLEGEALRKKVLATTERRIKLLKEIADEVSTSLKETEE